MNCISILVDVCNQYSGTVACYSGTVAFNKLHSMFCIPKNIPPYSLFSECKGSIPLGRRRLCQQRSAAVSVHPCSCVAAAKLDRLRKGLTQELSLSLTQQPYKAAQLQQISSQCSNYSSYPVRVAEKPAWQHRPLTARIPLMWGLVPY